MISLDSPVTAVLGGAASRAKEKAITEGLGLRTVGDLLRHFPRRYLDTGELTRVDELVEGQVLTVIGRITDSTVVEYRDRRTNRAAFRQETVLATDGPALRMTFFSKKRSVAQWHAERLPVGRHGAFTGRVSRFRGEWQLTNPTTVVFAGTDADDPQTRLLLDSIRGLYPLYPLTKGLDSSDLQRPIAFARTVVEELPEIVPQEVRRRHRLPDPRTALDWVHGPDTRAQVADAQRYYRFEEALVTQLVLARRRAELSAEGALARVGGGGLLAAFDARLPFTLTDGQHEVSEVLMTELARDRPMNRLLQGEVGSGKTVVALRAMLRVVDSGGQAALLAPTEVLAQQHHRSILALLGDLAQGGMLGGAEQGTTVALLTGSQPRAQRARALLDLASGEAGLVVGTHALLQEHVSFADLGLVVVDEQHRFGVEQRAALTDKAGSPPHLLVMTATPIPRTVAMTVFGDLEISTLTELPAGRAPIQTTVVPLLEQPGWLERVWARVREEVERGRQVYVVCPRIAGDEPEQGETDVVDVDAEGAVVTAEPGSLAAVEEVVGQLAAGPLSGLRVAALHGRLATEEKDSTMRAFAEGAVDVLVSTTVIEVGVDVANATMMVVLDADRFGISQLHQIRGRVGRGGHPGLCLLVTRAAPGTPSRERLEAVAATTDGFALSRTDLELRREGDVLGASQSGFRSSLQNLRVLRDEDTILAARQEAEALLAADPTLAGTPDLARAVDELARSVESAFMEKS
ncbi:MAG TPA: ATP-dependent DNA helicase RecG [Nocardioides sp.]|uniref:ATP-dependent DNA helicase RecG n=1 Tax=Nocardioides sp. TaxID=35761 RepID=UPI002C038F72|nr:ATP-dependent DNA helicase RecG [Nocardioides sp.]HQR27474.1 ATP-dependent DNA helicase RecG [Nocardioides sp.]